MYIVMLESKIHRATVTQAELDYVGSITIDRSLMDAAGILEYEKVLVVDVDNGNRFETYAIEGERDSHVICLNGAAARLCQVGDRVIIMTFCKIDAEEAKSHRPVVVFVDDKNVPVKTAHYEKHGTIEAY